MLSQVALLLLCLGTHADNVLARTRQLESSKDAVDENIGGCYPLSGTENNCENLAEDACRRRDDECDWVSSCPLEGERTRNLFEQPQGKHFCHLVDNQEDCDKSYRRPPKGKKARLCYWDSTKGDGKCKGGDKVECESLPRAIETSGRAVKCFMGLPYASGGQNWGAFDWDVIYNKNGQYQKGFDGVAKDNAEAKSHVEAHCLNFMMTEYTPSENMKEKVAQAKAKGLEPAFGYLTAVYGTQWFCYPGLFHDALEEEDMIKYGGSWWRKTCGFRSLLGLA